MEPEELNNSDRAILDELASGRCTPAALIDWTGLSKQTVHSRLNTLVAAEHVEKVHQSGLYELVDDPRSDIRDDERDDFRTDDRRDDRDDIRLADNDG